jgi:hypothetical protein
MDAASLVSGLVGVGLSGLPRTAAAPPAEGDPMTDAERTELSILAGLIAVQPNLASAELFVRQWKGNKRIMVKSADWLKHIRNPEL